MLSRLMTRKEQLVLLSFAGAVAVGALALIYHGSGNANADSPPALDAPAAVPEASTPAPPPEPLASHPEPPAQPEPIPQAPPPAEPTEVAVAVAGEAANPGMYMMPEGSRVGDLLEKAGGATDRADLADINLAARLLDGTTLIVPPRPGPGVRRRLSAQQNPPSYTISGWQPPAAPPAQETTAPPTPLNAAATPAQGSLNPGLIDLNHAGRQELESLPGIGPVLAAEIMRYRTQSPFASVEDLANVNGIGPQKLAAVRPLVTVR